MKKLVITLLLLTASACTNGANNPTTPDNTSKVSSANNKEQIPNIKDSFQIRKFDSPITHTNIKINNLGNGFVVFDNVLKKIENFKITNSEFTIPNENKGNSAIYINDEGNGLVFLLPEEKGCLSDTSECNIQGSIIGNEINNYNVSSKNIIVDSDNKNGLNGSSLAIEIPENNNGSLYWSKIVNYPDVKVIVRKISGLKLSGNNNDNKENIDLDAFQMSSINSQGTGMKIIKKDNSLFLQKIDKNIPSAQEILVNDDNSIKFSSAISLDDSGNGLVIWSSNGNSKYSIDGRYIKNYQIQ